MKRPLYIFIFSLLPISILLPGCDDDFSEDVRKNIHVASDIFLGQKVFFEAYLLVDQASRDTVLWNEGSVLIGEALVSVIQPGISILIDYGDSSVLCQDGFRRKGRIEASFPPGYLGDTLDLTIRFLDFFLNDREVGGEIQAHSQSPALDDGWKVELRVIGGSIQGSPRDILFETELEFLWYEGMISPYAIHDDKASVLEGPEIAGISSNGTAFRARIISPLEMERTCLWITSGELEMDTPSLFVRFGYMDFGSGECDAKAFLTFNGQRSTFYLD